MERVKVWVEANGLELHPSKTRLVDASLAGGFDFLGYHFEIIGVSDHFQAVAGKAADLERKLDLMTCVRGITSVTNGHAKMRFLAPLLATPCHYLPRREELAQEDLYALGAGGRWFKSSRPDQVQ